MGQNPFLDAVLRRRRRARPSRPSCSSCSRATASSRSCASAASSSSSRFADYVFEKSKLFAYLNLDDSELLIYEKLYALLAESVPRPDLVVYLQAPTEVLMRRIRRAARPEEARLSEEYLAEVNRAYNHYFFHYTQTPLLVVNTAEVDFVKRDEDLDDLAQADPRRWARARSTTCPWQR